MSYFAKVNKEGIVLNVIVAEPEFFYTFIDDEPGEWVQTDLYSNGGVHFDENGNPDGKPHLRYNFAGVGFIYDRINDAFYEQQPFPSWTLNTDTYCWECPVTKPNDSVLYEWDEENLSWVELQFEPTE